METLDLDVLRKNPLGSEDKKPPNLRDSFSGYETLGELREAHEPDLKYHDSVQG
jgi:hypothetical protein